MLCEADLKLWGMDPTSNNKADPASIVLCETDYVSFIYSARTSFILTYSLEGADSLP